MATGVLPVAIGQATRLIHYLGDAQKEYVAGFELGAVSDTQDAWGTLTYGQPKEVSRQQVEAVLQTLRGRILQEPPMYSAVHYQGQRLYDLARQGVVVEREKREVEIFSLDLLQLADNDGIISGQLKVACSQGTYIRTLIHDMGLKLETGAFMSSLVRTISGQFVLTDAVKLAELNDKPDSLPRFLLPMDFPLHSWSSLVVGDPALLAAVRNGQALIAPGSLDDQEMTRIYYPDGKLLALASSMKINDKAMLKPERVFNYMPPKEF